MSQFRFFVDLNLKSDLEGAATLNIKPVSCETDKIHELFFLKERSATYTKGMIGMKVSVNKEFIDVDGDGQRASGFPVRKRLKQLILERMYLMMI